MNETEVNAKLRRLEELEKKEEAVKERYRGYSLKSRAYNNILLRKAVEAGIKVSDKERDDEIKRLSTLSK